MIEILVGVALVLFFFVILPYLIGLIIPIPEYFGPIGRGFFLIYGGGGLLFIFLVASYSVGDLFMSYFL